MPLDDSLRRHGVHRVVEIRADGRVCSGYAVAADLVLTSRHGLGDAEECRIRPLGGDPADATVVWHGSSEVDAALLRVPSAPWRDDPGVAWTRWGAPEGDGVPVVARGFPKAKAAEGLRDLETMHGTVDHATGLASGRHSVDIATPELLSGEEGYWRGMSGAVALAEPALQVLGVVAFDPAAYRGRRLELIPAAELLRDEAFAGLVGSGALETVTRREPSTLDTVLAAPRVPLPAEHSDWQLLLPKYAVVPFQGREESRSGLLDWCRGPRAFDLAVITGDGGAGKTRLAAQVCAEIAAEGWDAGLVAESALRPEPEVLRPTLAVVDYAEPHAEVVGTFIRAMNGRGHGPPVRLLLVARTDVRGGRWWRDLNARSEGVADYLRPPIAALNAAPLSLEDRRGHATAALTAFGAAPGTELPGLDAPEYAHPMRLHMAALLAAREEEPGSRDSVLGQFLAREERLWLGSWSPDPHEEDRILTAQAVALVALASPLRTEVARVLALLPDVDGPTVRHLTRWIGTVFPGRDERLVFGPDILTEELLDRTEDLHLLLTALVGATEDDASLARILDTATLAAGSARVRGALTCALAEHLPRLAASALSDDAATLAPALDACLRLLTRDPSLRPILNAACAKVVEETGDPFRHWYLRATIAAGAVDRYKTVGDAESFAATGADLATYWLHDRQLDLAEKIVREVFATGHAGALLQTNAAVLAFCLARPEQAARHIGEAVRLNAGDDGRLAAALMNQAVVRSWRRDLHGAATSLKEAAAIVGDDEVVDALVAFTAHFPPWEPGGADAVPAGFLLHNRFGVPTDLPGELRRAAVALTRQAVAALDRVEPGRATARALDDLAFAVTIEPDALDIALLEAVTAFIRREAGDVEASIAGVMLVEARGLSTDYEAVLRDVAWLAPALAASGASAKLRAQLKLDEAAAFAALERHTEARTAVAEAEELYAGEETTELRRMILQQREGTASALGEHDVALALTEALVQLARAEAETDPEARIELLYALTGLVAARDELGMDVDDHAAETARLWLELRDELPPEMAMTMGVSLFAAGVVVTEAEVERLLERLRAARVIGGGPLASISAEALAAAAMTVLLLRHKARRPFDAELAAETRTAIEDELAGRPALLAQLDTIIALTRGRVGDELAALDDPTPAPPD